MQANAHNLGPQGTYDMMSKGVSHISGGTFTLYDRGLSCNWGTFGVAVMFVFTFLEYAMSSYGYSVIVFVIAFFLGERFELSLSQSLNIIDGDLTLLLSHPVALLLIIMAIVSALWFGIKSKGQPGQTASTHTD